MDIGMPELVSRDLEEGIRQFRQGLTDTSEPADPDET
jgi:hypothetical protein